MGSLPILRNKILRSLPAAELARIGSYLEPVPLVVGKIYAEEGEPLTHAYFPNTGLMSLINHLQDGGSIEVAAVGQEGLVGVNAFLGVATSPVQVIAQIEGEAVRMPVRHFLAESALGGALHHLVARYTSALLTSSGQTIACNRFHNLEARCARLLLATHDRVSGDTFRLTQDFLSVMLGVRRAGVTVAAGALQKAGFISYTHSRITIVDRAGLETAACECYEVVREELDGMFEGTAASPQVTAVK